MLLLLKINIWQNKPILTFQVDVLKETQQVTIVLVVKCIKIKSVPTYHLDGVCWSVVEVSGLISISQ